MSAGIAAPEGMPRVRCMEVVGGLEAALLLLACTTMRTEGDLGAAVGEEVVGCAVSLAVRLCESSPAHGDGHDETCCSEVEA